MISAVLFDLDGTLADTAPDLALALNLTREDEGLPPLALERLRPWASQGARGLLAAGMDLAPETDGYEPARQRFLAHYRANLARHTQLFAGVSALLLDLEHRDIPWGIVTNKPGWLTDPLLDALKLSARAACAISGDTTPTPKPHPAPLLLACEQIGMAPGNCIYVGDDRRDITAGRAAGTATLAARWGYIAMDDDPDTWGADAVIDAPPDTLRHVRPKTLV